jgi:hypothetical protein
LGDHLSSFLETLDLEKFESSVLPFIDEPAGSLALAIEAPELLFICSENGLELPLALAEAVLKNIVTYEQFFRNVSGYFPLLGHLAPNAFGRSLPTRRQPDSSCKSSISSVIEGFERKWISRCMFLDIAVKIESTAMEVAHAACFNLHKCHYLASAHSLITLTKIQEGSTPSSLALTLSEFTVQAKSFLGDVAEALNCPLLKWECHLLNSSNE